MSATPSTVVEDMDAVLATGVVIISAVQVRKWRDRIQPEMDEAWADGLSEGLESRDED